MTTVESAQLGKYQGDVLTAPNPRAESHTPDRLTGSPPYGSYLHQPPPDAPPYGESLNEQEAGVLSPVVEYPPMPDAC